MLMHFSIDYACQFRYANHRDAMYYFIHQCNPLIYYYDHTTSQ